MLALVVVNTLLVALVVVIHYESMAIISKLLPKIPVKHRLRILIGVYGALIAHGVEVWVFGIGYFILNKMGSWGTLEGNFDGTLVDCVYFSFSTYTTLGFGDIQPLGDLRYLTGIESLTGLVLITWTASFLFIEMDKYWKMQENR